MAAGKKEIRFGIMGCASIARKICRAISLSPNSTLVAIASRSLEKASLFRDQNDLPSSLTLHPSYEDLLHDPNVDAVYLPLPTTLHLKWAVAVARSGKHVLLEKPVALHVAELDAILKACEENGVQFMDGTMWMHHPRTTLMKDFLSDASRFGELKMVSSVFSFAGGPDFFSSNVRVKTDLDSLGALGDVGWYCIGAILWASDFELPKSVVALEHPVLNEAGVIISCGASLTWEDGKVATFHCSFLENLTMQLCAIGTKGTLHSNDFVVPFEETSAGFMSATESRYTDLHTGWKTKLTEQVVNNNLPQETLMVSEFSRLAANILHGGGRPDSKWPAVSRKTQLVIDAVKASIDKGLRSVNVAE